MTQWVETTARRSSRSLQMQVLLERAAAQQPADAALQRRLAEAPTRSGSHLRAAAAWQRIIELDPKDGSAWMELGGLLFEARQLNEAVGALKQACRLLPDVARGHAMLGRALRALGADAEAEAAFDCAIALSPDDPVCVRAVGRRLVRAGRGAELADHCLAVAARTGWRVELLDHLLIARALQQRSADVATMVDYRQLLRQQIVTPPEPYPTLSAFNTALANEFRNSPHLRLDGEYASDIVAGGFFLTRAAVEAASSTGAIAALRMVFMKAYADYCDAIETQAGGLFHRLKPSWARLAVAGQITRRAGHVRSHTHSGSWLVGVYYAAVPDSPALDKSGCLHFGPPQEIMNLPENIWPHRVIRPVAGLLVLFPGYFAHWTWPNQTEGDRIALAFDVVPAQT